MVLKKFVEDDERFDAKKKSEEKGSKKTHVGRQLNTQKNIV